MANIHRLLVLFLNFAVMVLSFFNFLRIVQICIALFHESLSANFFSFSESR